MKKLLAALGVSVADIAFEEVDKKLGLTKPLMNVTDVSRIALFAIGAIDYVTGVISKDGEIGEGLVLSTMPLVAHTVKNATSQLIVKGFKPAQQPQVIVVPQTPPQTYTAPAPRTVSAPPASASLMF